MKPVLLLDLMAERAKLLRKEKAKSKRKKDPTEYFELPKGVKFKVSKPK